MELLRGMVAEAGYRGEPSSSVCVYGVWVCGCVHVCGRPVDSPAPAPAPAAAAARKEQQQGGQARRSHDLLSLPCPQGDGRRGRRRRRQQHSAAPTRAPPSPFAGWCRRRCCPPDHPHPAPATAHTPAHRIIALTDERGGGRERVPHAPELHILWRHGSVRLSWGACVYACGMIGWVEPCDLMQQIMPSGQAANQRPDPTHATRAFDAWVGRVFSCVQKDLIPRAWSEHWRAAAVSSKPLRGRAWVRWADCDRLDWGGRGAPGPRGQSPPRAIGGGGWLLAPLMSHSASDGDWPDPGERPFDSATPSEPCGTIEGQAHDRPIPVKPLRQSQTPNRGSIPHATPAGGGGGGERV